MRVAHARVSDVRYALLEPLVTATGVIADRSGVVLELVDERGRRGFGEASPLPGFSVEPLEQVRRLLVQLEQGLGPLVGRTFLDRSDVRALTAVLDWPPSALHALEQALVDLLGQVRGRPAAAILGSTYRPRVLVHRLVTGPQSAAAAVADGVRCVKLKVATQPLADELAILAAVRQAVGADVQIRVDANGGWDLATARQALGLMSRYRLSCVEQPVPADELDGMAELALLSGVAIAADEGLRNRADLEATVARRAANIVVIKPMLVGGPIAALELLEAAFDAGLDAYVTTTIDGPIGRLSALHVAAAAPMCALLPCGLDTAPLLQGGGPSRATRGWMHVSERAGFGVSPREVPTC